LLQIQNLKYKTSKDIEDLDSGGTSIGAETMHVQRKSGYSMKRPHCRSLS